MSAGQQTRVTVTVCGSPRSCSCKVLPASHPQQVGDRKPRTRIGFAESTDARGVLPRGRQVGCGAPAAVPRLQEASDVLGDPGAPAGSTGALRSHPLPRLSTSRVPGVCTLPSRRASSSPCSSPRPLQPHCPPGLPSSMLAKPSPWSRPPRLQGGRVVSESRALLSPGSSLWSLCSPASDSGKWVVRVVPPSGPQRPRKDSTSYCVSEKGAQQVSPGLSPRHPACRAFLTVLCTQPPSSCSMWTLRLPTSAVSLEPGSACISLSHGVGGGGCKQDHSGWRCWVF